MIEKAGISLLLGCCAALALAQPPAPPAIETPATAVAEAPVSAQAAIGWKLFFDKRLTRDENFSCGSCHDPEKGFSDGRRFGSGVHGDVLSRNTPTVVNL
ncbi:MAG: cytochrome-c peroxidase, partial [Gammaproteobacteria bacterium]